MYILDFYFHCDMNVYFISETSELQIWFWCTKTSPISFSSANCEKSSFNIFVVLNILLQFAFLNSY